VAPEWQDLSFKVFLPTKNMGRFSVWGLGGISEAGEYAVKDTSEWNYRDDAFEDNEKHTIGIAGITHNYLFNDSKTYIKTVASYSYTMNNVMEDSLNSEYDRTLLKQEDFIYNTFIINSYVNHKFNARNVLRIGAAYQDKSYNLHVLDLNEETHLQETKIKSDGRTGMAESFVQWQYRINDKIDLNTGLHYTYLALNDDFAVEPRMGLKWKINCKNTLNLGAGLHSRVEAISIYLAEQTLEDGTVIYPNTDLRLTKAAHFVLGYSWNFAPDFMLKTEVYYQYLYDVPVVPGDTTHVKSTLNFSSGFTNENLVNDGTGRNYGVELTLEKFFSHDWYMLTTASFFESKYTMPDGIERNTFFNSKYIFNVVGGKEFKVGSEKQNIIGLNLRTIWRGGYRTVPVDLEASQQQHAEVRIFDEAFESKVPDYFRVDLGVSYRKNKPDWVWVLSLDIQNLTNRANIWDEEFNPEMNAMERTYMVGLVPVLNYRIEF
jgi:outer membrane receptor protein involved in Fe transport